MSAPDKIYRHRGELRTSFASDTRLDDEDVEYIRKDYLLEWAKEMYEAYRKRYEQRNALYYRERAAAFLKVIDKLNQM